MIRKDLFPQYEDFFTSLKFSLTNYADKFNLTMQSHFSNKLGFTADNKESQFNQLLNPSKKDLTVRELIFLLKIIKEDSKPFLDYLAKEANLLVSKKADTLTHLEQVKDVLLKFQIDNGLLNANYLQAIADGEISKDEIKTLKALSYQYRSRLNQFEFLLDEILKGKKNDIS